MSGSNEFKINVIGTYIACCPLYCLARCAQQVQFSFELLEHRNTGARMRPYNIDGINDIIDFSPEHRQDTLVPIDGVPAEVGNPPHRLIPRLLRPSGLKGLDLHQEVKALIQV